MIKKAFLLLPLLTLLLSCQPEQKEQFGLLILNARIADVATGETSGPRLIGIRGDTIRLVADMEGRAKYDAPVVLDAENKIVLPGLWDMHVHFRGGDTLIEENRNLLPLFLAHGVTTIRDAGGDITPAVLGWRRDIREGRLAGPDIFTSGPKLDGSAPAWPGSLPIATAEAVASALDSLEQLGVDYVKTYDGNLSEEMYYAIIRAASARGLKVTGHMPLSADLLRAVDLGLAGIEHLYYVLNAASPVGDSLRTLNRGYGMLPALLETYDDGLAREAFRKLGEQGFYVTPTLHIGRVLSELKTTNHAADSLLAYIGPGIQRTYERRLNAARNASPRQQQMRMELQQRFRSMIRPLAEAGVTLLAGSDCGPFNSFVYPGASLHGELIALVEAGLTPREALAASILHGPRFFGLSDFYGSIEAGKAAHLILLVENPLEDIEHIAGIEVVVKGGEVYDRGRMREMLAVVRGE